MTRRGVRAAVFLAVGAVVLGFGPRAWAAHDEDLLTGAKETLGQYKATDPGLGVVLGDSAGYAVFPNVSKGGLVVGGAAGDGVVFSHGKAIGKVNLSQVTVGAQIGGQTYSQLIVFHDRLPLDELKANHLTFNAQVSAVALESGVSENAKYTNGVMVITASKGGFMAEASVGGQKFKYEPFDHPIPVG